MNIKKVLLLTSVALAVTAAAIPASASAVELKDNGNQLINREIEINGNVKVTALGSGTECAVDARILVNKATVEMKKFEVTVATCVIIGAGLKNCKVKSTLTTSIPWAMKFTMENLTMQTGLIDTELESKAGVVCPTKTRDITIKDVRLTPDNVNAISFFTVFGEVKIDTDGGKEETGVMEGSLSVAGADSKTFEYS